MFTDGQARFCDRKAVSLNGTSRRAKEKRMLSQTMCCGDSTRIINERLSEISESVKDVLYN